LTFRSTAPAPTILPAAPPPVAPVDPTPWLELRVGTDVTHCLALASAPPGAAIHDAVKANPHPAGVFTGPVETLDEAIGYRLETAGADGPTGRACSPGRPATAPTCSTRRRRYGCRSLAEGEVLRIHAAGAHSTCYSTVGFNGFAPPPTVVAR
jgi:hypothetical protein